VFDRGAGASPAAALAISPLDERGARAVIVNAFGRPLAGIERDWRADLDSLTAS
jgi:hypothetical protein